MKPETLFDTGLESVETKLLDTILEALRLSIVNSNPEGVFLRNVVLLEIKKIPHYEVLLGLNDEEIRQKDASKIYFEICILKLKKNFFWKEEYRNKMALVYSSFRIGMLMNPNVLILLGERSYQLLYLDFLDRIFEDLSTNTLKLKS